MSVFYKEPGDIPGIKNVAQLKKSLSDPDVEAHCMLEVDNFRLFNLKYGTANGNNVLSQIEKIAKEELDPKYWFYLGAKNYYFTMQWDDDRLEASFINFFNNLRLNLDIYISIGIVSNLHLSPSALLLELEAATLFAKMRDHGSDGINFWR